MWRCLNCNEQVENHFEVCWNCQFTQNGTPQVIYADSAEEAQAVLTPCLGSGEVLHHWAYAVSASSVKTRLLLALLGAAWAMLLPFSLQATFARNTGDGAGGRISTWLSLLVMASLFCGLFKLLVAKRWLVGLTNRRLIVVKRGGESRVKKVEQYNPEALTVFKSPIKDQQIAIEIREPGKSFKAIFHHTSSGDNLKQAVEIIEMLNGIKLQADKGQYPG